MVDLAPGIERSAQYLVTSEMSPPHLHPAQVLGTSALVELMERTALDSIQPYVESHETSVGTRIDVHHLRPAFPGAMLDVHSRLVDVGPRLEFELTAVVADRVVGTARHERAIVDRARFAPWPESASFRDRS